MKKLRIVGLGIVIFLVASLFAVFISTTVFAASASEKGISYYDIQTLSHELFGDVRIKSSEFLYNFDGSADFIYVDFEDYGYAVFSADTLELLEYAPQGGLPYNTTKKYYGGPTNYFQRNGEQFTNTVTGNSISRGRDI